MILNTVRDRGPLSRLQISNSCSLSVATAKRLVDELISVGMLREGSHLKSSGRGRKPSVIGLSRRYGYTVGVVIEPGRLSTTVLGFDGSAIYKKETSPSTDARGPLQELLIAETAEAIAACSDEENGPLLGIGIGVAGLVDARSGVVVYCPGLPG